MKLQWYVIRILSYSYGLYKSAVREDEGLESLKRRSDRSKLAWWQLDNERYPRLLLDTEWEVIIRIVVDRGRPGQ